MIDRSNSKKKPLNEVANTKLTCARCSYCGGPLYIPAPAEPDKATCLLGHDDPLKHPLGLLKYVQVGIQCIKRFSSFVEFFARNVLKVHLI